MNDEFIKCICGATAQLNKDKNAYVCSVCLTETPIKERSKTMGKKGTCKDCGREMSIVAGGRCWKCYAAYKKNKKPGSPIEHPKKKRESPIEECRDKDCFGLKPKLCIYAGICKFFKG